MAAIPLSYAVSSPVSAALLGLEGAAGLRGWQWLFIVEAIPSILLAFAAYFYLTDRPADARWLPGDRRRWLQRRLFAAEGTRREQNSPTNVLARLYDYRVLALSLVYLRLLGVRLRRKLLDADHRQGLWPFDRDDWLGQRHSLRRRLLRHRLVGAAIGLSGGAHDASRRRAGALGGRHWRFRLSRRPSREDDCADYRRVRRLAALPIFWTLPTAFLAGTAVAPGIAAINAIGNLAGFSGPFVMGWMKDATGSFALGLLTIAACPVIALVIALALGHDQRLERAPEAAQ